MCARLRTEGGGDDVYIVYTLVRACGWFLVVRPGEFRTPAEFGLKLCTRDDVEFAAIDMLVATAARLAMLGNCLRTLEITQITCNLTCVCVPLRLRCKPL